MLFICLYVGLKLHWLFEHYTVFLLVIKEPLVLKFQVNLVAMFFFFLYRKMTTIVYFITYVYPRGKEHQINLSSYLAKANERLDVH